MRRFFVPFALPNCNLAEVCAAGGTPKANGTQDCECNITLVMLADKTACVVTNDAARNTPKVTECRFQAVELGFLSLEVIGLGEYAA